MADPVIHPTYFQAAIGLISVLGTALAGVAWRTNSKEHARLDSEVKSRVTTEIYNEELKNNLAYRTALNETINGLMPKKECDTELKSIGARFDEGNQLFHDLRQDMARIRESQEKIEDAVYVIVKALAPLSGPDDELSVLKRKMADSKVWPGRKE